MLQQNTSATTRAATPSSGKKRAFRPDDERLENDAAKKHKSEHHDVHGPFSEQMRRGRTRWRTGSEPAGWSGLEPYGRRITVAWYDDSLEAEKSPQQSPETDTAASP
ncbi:hypothetical protein V8C35DRAFT_279254 [Trichoderma chlorosporum]